MSKNLSTFHSLRRLRELYYKLIESEVLYLPLKAPFRCYGMNYEEALVLKIDGDLSLKQTESLDTRYRLYLREPDQPRNYLATSFMRMLALVEERMERETSRHSQTKEEREIRQYLFEKTGEYYRIDTSDDDKESTAKSFSEDLLNQPNLSAAAVEWIRRNAALLDADQSIRHDDYRSPVEANLCSLEDAEFALLKLAA